MFKIWSDYAGLVTGLQLMTEFLKLVKVKENVGCRGMRMGVAELFHLFTAITAEKISETALNYLLDYWLNLCPT